jgi:hypothetical protein
MNLLEGHLEESVRASPPSLIRLPVEVRQTERKINKLLPATFASSR